MLPGIGRCTRFYTALICMAACACMLAPAGAGTPVRADTASAVSLVGRPLVFEPNVGQADAGVRFLTRASGAAIFFAPDEVTFSLPGDGPPEQSDGVAQPVQASPVVARLRFLDANPSPTLTPGKGLPGWTNYFQGSDPSRWHTHVSTYSDITYQALYPGIDLVYSGAGSRLKSTYTIAAGVDPSLIRWRYEGATSVRADQTGNLTAEYNTRPESVGGENQGGQSSVLTEEAPVAWQEVAGRQVAVPVKYLVDSEGAISFELGSYDHTQPLTIDPTLDYSTFFGGIGEEAGYAIAVDGAGNIYLSGYTSSSHTFPPMNSIVKHGLGYWDAFVTKLSADGQSMVFSTFLSGTDWDLADSLALDGADNIFVGGETASTDFPVRNAYQSHYGGGPYDAFVTEFNSSGELVYSTYLGGSGSDRGRGLGLDKSGRVAINGYTDSTDFPLANPVQGKYGGGFNDAFVAKLDPSNSKLIYSTFLGGSGVDLAWNLATDGAGNVIVTGYTSSVDFPLQHPYQARFGGGAHDVFVSKLNADGSALIYSTYLGGNAEDIGRAVVADAAGNTYVVGSTTSQDFPTANGLQQSLKGSGSAAFVAKLDASGSGLAYSTYLGGSSSAGTSGDEALAIAVDAEGSAYVAGATDSSDFPLVRPLQAVPGGSIDGFLSKIKPSGTALDYSTYLGGVGEEHPFALAVDGGGNVYITGETHSSNFPVARPFQVDMFGSGDVFVAKISDTPDSTITPQMVRTPAASPTYIFITEDDEEGAAPEGSSTPASTPGAQANESATAVAVPSAGSSLSVTPTGAVFPTTISASDQQGNQAGLLVWFALLLGGLVASTAIFVVMRKIPKERPNREL
jgi:hypothetical protein